MWQQFSSSSSRGGGRWGVGGWESRIVNLCLRRLSPTLNMEIENHLGRAAAFVKVEGEL